jgi:hypothetical protein
VPGRFRLRLAEPLSSADTAALVDRVAAHGAARVVGRPNTGSLIVETDEPAAAFAARLDAAGLIALAPLPPAEPFRQGARLRLSIVDAVVLARTDGALDLRGAVAILLFGAAIYQAARGRLLGPAATMASLALTLIAGDRR